jgi:hypothetical protein
MWVVGIGSSTGGIEAVRELLPSDLTGWTFEITEATAFGEDPGSLEALQSLRSAGA